MMPISNAADYHPDCTHEDVPGPFAGHRISLYHVRLDLCGLAKTPYLMPCLKASTATEEDFDTDAWEDKESFFFFDTRQTWRIAHRLARITVHCADATSIGHMIGAYLNELNQLPCYQLQGSDSYVCRLDWITKFQSFLPMVINR